MKENKIKRFATDFIYGTVSLVAMNAVLSLLVNPSLEKNFGAERYGQMLFYTALMGLLASVFGTGANYARMKVAATQKTENGEYNRFLSAVVLVTVVVVFICMLVMPDTAGASYIGIVVLIVATVFRYYGDVQYRLDLNYRNFFFYYILIAVGYVVGILLYPITKSWVCVFLCGELFGLCFVTIKGTVFRKPYWGRTTGMSAHIKTMTSMSMGFLLSEFVIYMDRILLPIFVSDEASSYFYIATLVGKMTSLLSTPLNGVISGHLARYQERFTKKMFAKVAVALVGVAVVLVVGTVIGSHLFVAILYPDTYDKVNDLFLLANAGQVIFFLSNTLMVVMLRFASERYQLYIGIVYSVLFFVVFVPAIKYAGIWGAAWGMFAVNLIKFLMIIGVGFYVLHKENTKKVEE